MAASVIYELDAWSLRRQTAVHFAVMAVTVFPARVLSGWFRTQTVGGFATIGGYFVAVGLISWFLAYLVFGLLVPRLKNRARPIE